MESQKWTRVVLALAMSVVANFAETRAAKADELTFAPDLATAGWTVVSFPFKSALTFTVVNNTTIEVVADRAAGMIWRALPEAASRHGKAQWSWRAEEMVGPTDLTLKSKDDRALAVYFIFGVPEDRGKSVMSLLASSSVSALVYVFGGDRERGAILDSPHMKPRGKFIVLRAAATDRKTWLDERVDLAADFQRAFGRPAPHLLGIAVSSDSDDTGGRNQVRLRGLQTRE